MRARTGAVAGLVMSSAVVLGVPVAWSLDHRQADGVGSLPATVVQTVPATPPAAYAPSAAGSAVARPVRPLATAVPAPVPAAVVVPAPVQLVIPSVGIRAGIDTVGVAADGNVAIPADAYRVGWYQFGPAPGSATGSAVLVGHRDSRTQGKGALYSMSGVQVGDSLMVTLADHSTWSYRVVERRLYLKQGLQLQQFFGRTGPARLTVITCGGDYDRAHGGYQDNLVVTALLVGRVR